MTEKLCVPLLLGLPFLSMNHIVADFKLCSAIDKTNGYDLLHPPVLKHRNKLYDSKINMAKVKEMKKVVLSELVEVVCKHCLAEGKMVPEFIKPLDVAGIIKEHIEVLSFQRKVETIEKCLLKDFSDVFQPLPHVNNLPQDVTAKIKLKDTEQTIKTCTYACP